MFAIVLLFSCKAKKNIVEQASNSDLIISLEKTPCYGECPVFTIEIYSDGKIIYKGKQFTDKIGTFMNNINTDEVNVLIQDFNNSNFFNFEDEYTSEMTDFPTTYIVFNFEGKTKRIKDYYGAPAELKLLESTIERYAKLNNWEKITDKP